MAIPTNRASVNLFPVNESSVRAGNLVKALGCMYVNPHCVKFNIDNRGKSCMKSSFRRLIFGADVICNCSSNGKPWKLFG